MPLPATTTAGHQLRVAVSLVSELRGGLAAATSIVRGSAFGTSAVSSELRPGVIPEPVILVHGLGANSSCFNKLQRWLCHAGYTVYCVNYSCLGADLADCGRRLEREAAWLRNETGCASASVVAHSLGGVVLRSAMAHSWMRDWVRVAVTLGTPHHGTPAARLAPSGLPGFGRIISQLRPSTDGDDSDAPDQGVGRTTRWVAVAAEHDWVVPAKYARLPGAENVRNVTVPWGGHWTLPNSSHCLQIVLDELAGAEPRKDDASAA